MIDLAILLTIGFAASSHSPKSLGQQQPQPQPGGQADFPVYANFETSTNGTTVTASILDDGTPVKGCSWRDDFVRTTAMKVSTDAQHNLLSTLLAGGEVWTDFGSTRGVTFDVSILGTTGTGQRRVGGGFECVFTASSDTASVGYWVKTTIPTSDTGYYSMLLIGNSAGSDFTSLMIHSGHMYLEVKANPNGAPNTGTFFNYTADTWYWVTAQFQKYTSATSVHTLYIYDASGNLINYQTKSADSSNPSNPNKFFLGRGGDLGTPSALVYYDNIVADTNGSFPISPNFSLAQVIP
jgi:hypothetical protein